MEGEGVVRAGLVVGEGAGGTVIVGGELSVKCKAPPIGWTFVA